MIIYFADREMRILGHATAELRQGYVISEDLKTDDVETGVASFNCGIGFTEENRAQLEKMTNAGNYLLRSNDGDNEFYTIIDSEIDTKNQHIYIYAEDAGLDLLNSRADAFESDGSYVAEYYVNKYLANSSFEIGIFEIPRDAKRKLKWESESTVTERLASIATQFGGYEISYSFTIKGLEVTHKYINFRKQRGKDEGVQLRLNKELDRIVTTKTVANLATAFVCEGGIPDNAEKPITLKGYAYDDGDFYVDSTGTLKSRNAVAKWSRLVWETKLNQAVNYEGHIVRPYSYNTTSQKELCSHAVTELKKYCDMEVNYEVDITRLPEGVKVGDRVNIIDDAGELYLSTRILKLETSVIDKKHTATLGEHIIKKGGIAQKVLDLAAEFSKTTVSVERALTVSNAAKVEAEEALVQAEAAAEEAIAANTASEEAQAAAEVAKASAATAEAQALAAEAAVDRVESSVQSIQNSVENAQAAADNAEKAAENALDNAEEAQAAAEVAKASAAVAENSADVAKRDAIEAQAAATTAQTTAAEAKTAAQTASDTAAAAKADAEQAEKDVAAFGENLETYKTTMEADYARKTELTETTASLQAQITANASQISSNLSKITTVDETANNAKELAEEAQTKANQVQQDADTALQWSNMALSAADEAQNAADNAQTAADKAKAAAAAAQGVADKAEQDLETAKADLATVQGRVDATEEEIEAAQAAVDAAQAAADQAKKDAASAAQLADEAEDRAATAFSKAEAAQTTATNAANAAAAAQQTADQAKGDASTAQAKANEAASAAATAQSTADTAAETADAARSKADSAQAKAVAAGQEAAKAQAAVTYNLNQLNTAKQNLADTVARVDATEADIEAAQAAVDAAQAAADAAQAVADAAQEEADKAKEDAATAQKAADDAQTAADNAQAAADEAKEAADKAQADADALAIRVTTAETNITQTNERIDLCATKQEFADLSIGGRNLILNSKTFVGENIEIGEYASLPENNTYKGGQVLYCSIPDDAELTGNECLRVFIYPELGKTYTFSFDVKKGAGYPIPRLSFDGGVNCAKYVASDGGSSVNPTNGKEFLTSSEWKRYWITWTLKSYGDITQQNTIFISARASSELYIANIKLEKGNKATDWTPAPEDVTAEMLAEVESLRGTFDEQTSQVLTEAEKVTIQHLESYTEKDEFETFKETTETALYVEGGAIDMRFKSTEETLSNVDETVQTKFTELEKFITFTEDGIKISTGNNSMTLELDNDIISFKKNGVQFGWWDGVDFHTGNIVVNVDERAQFGNFAFVPRSDGSLMFLKVGD